MTKPFATEELRARVRALGRRNGAPLGPLRVADLTLDVARHTVWRAEHLIELTPTGFELLAYVRRHPGQVLSRNQIVENVWRDTIGTESKVVELYVHYLRNKIERQAAQPLVRTVRGVGYMIDG